MTTLFLMYFHDCLDIWHGCSSAMVINTLRATYDIYRFETGPSSPNYSR